MAVQIEHFALIDNYYKKLCCFIIIYILLCEQFKYYIENYRSVVTIITLLFKLMSHYTLRLALTLLCVYFVEIFIYIYFRNPITS